jgi:hypothetical protein
MRSDKNGDLSKAELVSIARLFRSEAVRAQLLDQAEEMDAYACDVLVFEGDLTVDGDFDTGDTGHDEIESEGTVLVVRGNLTVRGQIGRAHV